MAELKLQQSRLDGRYDVLECLGRGSYAEIYVAKDNAADEGGGPTTVVIKALNIFLQETPDAELERTLVTNFQNEAVALDRVRHPNIISRLGHGTAIDLANTTFHYIVLEYLPGGDMAMLSRHRPLPIHKALFYLEQVCSGLAHAHSCGVIHRDIKPQNLLLTSDRKILKIADFGVARLESSEGVITRVGTNLYAAPEHSPLFHTGQLDTGSLISSSVQLTPAADIYSLGKTTYSLLAGEAPRRFAHRSIKELPDSINNEYWSQMVLRVLEKATQTRPENRYQTVEEFWDELTEASLAPTQLLTTENIQRKRSADLVVEPEEITQAPPKPRFEVAQPPEQDQLNLITRRPRIVVPVSTLPQPADRAEISSAQISERDVVAPFPERSEGVGAVASQSVAGRSRRFIVALLLILSFSGMLLATHKYVTSRWNPLSEIPRVNEFLVVGREGVTTTDVNLRSDPSRTNAAIGLAESGSRVKVLAVNENWYEVQVMQHGRTKADPYSSDRGWMNKRFLKFD